MPTRPTLIKKITLGCLTPFTLATALASTPILNPVPQPISTPQPPHVSAKAYYVMDYNTGTVIAQKNATKHLAPASLTKLMTLYLTFQALQNGELQLSDKVLVSKKAWKMGGSRMFLREGTRVSVSKLIQGVIVDSGNDACTALAEHIAGNEANFIRMMNEAAYKLELKDTHFADVTGLPKRGHYSSAKDLSHLAQQIIHLYPAYYHYFSQKWLRYNKIKQANRNRLLWRDSSVDGLKTGHTDSAGYCLAASAKRHGMRLISVVMGTPSDAARANVSQRLLNYGFRFYKTETLIQGKQTLTHVRVWMGSKPTLPAGIRQKLQLTVPSSNYAQLQARLVIKPNLKAPVLAGQAVGMVDVILENKVIAKTPLIALESSPRGGFWTRISDHLSLFWKKLF